MSLTGYEYEYEALREENERLRELLAKSKTLMMPWIDKAIGRQGTVSADEWCNLFDQIQEALARPCDGNRP